MMGYYGTGAWGSWMVMAMWIWPLIVALAVWALVALTKDRRTPADDPVAILKRRFARGEISQEEYLKGVEILNNGSSRAVRS